MQERRKGERLLRAGKMHVRVFTLSGFVDIGDERSQCELLDVSKLGVRLHSAMDFPTGTVLDLRVQVQGSEEAHVRRGEVRWVLETGAEGSGECSLGIAFTDGESENASAWDAMIDGLEIASLTIPSEETRAES